MEESDLLSVIEITADDFGDPELSYEDYYEVRESEHPLFSLMWLVNKPDRLVWLEAVKPYLTNADFTALFKEAWITVEFPSHSGVKTTTLSKWFREADKPILMSEEDYKIFSSLPDQVTAYRGTTASDPVNSLSWSLSENTAKSFYKRYDLIHGDGVIIKTTMPKKWILAYFNDRNEHEIIVNPRQVWDATEIYKPADRQED